MKHIKCYKSAGTLALYRHTKAWKNLIQKVQFDVSFRAIILAK